ncbi:MAG: carbohydrate deacetylase [Candidatus Limnocylindria bacterium]
MKRLIVNADDLGRSEGIDSGIARAHRDGIVTSATFMANAPGAERGAAVARANPELGVGVHLVLTYARPLSDPASVPSLVEPDGSFPRGPSRIVGRGRVRSDEALREYRAQYERARSLLGREPTHLDTHHWVQEEPAVFDALLALARATGLAARHLDGRERELLRGAGVRTTDRYTREFQGPRPIDVPALLGLLERIAAAGEGSTELMCHPGEPDAELERTSAYARDRVAELATLTDATVRDKVVELGFVLSTYGDV